MSPHPSPLADTVASLRAATMATPAHAWLPAAIHALVLACLARLFGRLEEMIRLWQAGLLPPPAQRSRTAPASRPRAARRNPDSVHHRRPAMQSGNHKEAGRQGDDSSVSALIRLSVSLPPCENPAVRTAQPDCARNLRQGHLVGLTSPPASLERPSPKSACHDHRRSTPYSFRFRN